jgi:hypothetical protein
MRGNTMHNINQDDHVEFIKIQELLPGLDRHHYQKQTNLNATNAYVLSLIVGDRPEWEKYGKKSTAIDAYNQHKTTNTLDPLSQAGRSQCGLASQIIVSSTKRIVVKVPISTTISPTISATTTAGASSVDKRGGCIQGHVKFSSSALNMKDLMGVLKSGKNVLSMVYKKVTYTADLTKEVGCGCCGGGVGGVI